MFYRPDCPVKALLFNFSKPWEHPRISLQGSFRIRAPFYKAGLQLRLLFETLLSQGHCSSCISQPSRGLHSYWQVIRYFQIMDNHSNLAFFLISTSEWRKYMKWLMCTLFSFSSELLFSRWAMLLVQRDSMKEHLPIFLIVTNYADENVQHFFLCLERKSLALQESHCYCHSWSLRHNWMLDAHLSS